MDEKGITDNIEPCKGCGDWGVISSRAENYADADISLELIEAVTNSTVTELLISVSNPEMPGVKLAEQIGCSNAWISRTRQKDFFRMIQEHMELFAMKPAEQLYSAYLNTTLLLAKISFQLMFEKLNQE